MYSREGPGQVLLNIMCIIGALSEDPEGAAGRNLSGRCATGYSVYMVIARAPANGRRYQARPGRAAIVAADLADLHGPVSGIAELPLRLFWNPDRTFDLCEPELLRWMYENVLREATRPEDLASYLNGDVLVAVWQELFLPRGVRRAWEDRHPALRAAARPAA